MNEDIIIVLNWNESNKIKRAVFDLYKCFYKINKNKTFTGPLWIFDINSSQIPSNLDIASYKEFIDIITRNNALQTGKNRFVLDEDAFLKVLEFGVPKGLIFFVRGKENISLINRIADPNISYDINIRKQPGSKTKFNIEIGMGNDNVFVKRDSIFFNLYSLSFIIKGNELLFLNRKINAEFMNNIILNNYTFDEKQLAKYDKLISYIDENNIYFKDYIEVDFILSDIKPVPYLYISFEQENIYGNVKFEYSSSMINSDNGEEYVIEDGKKILRNRVMENSYLTFFLESYWAASKNRTYKYIGSDIETSISILLNSGWNVFNEFNQRLNILSKPMVNISNNIDWFDINIQYQVDSKIVQLADLLDKLGKKKRWIEVDNRNIYMIPSFVKNYKDIFIKTKGNKNSIKVVKQNIGTLSGLIKEVKPQMSNMLENYTSYEDINIEIPDSIYSKLRTYQVDGVKWLKYLNVSKFGGCLADDMGLGKTFQIIALLSDNEIRMQKGASLIIVPYTLLFNWYNEITKFNPSLRATIYHGPNRSNDMLYNEDDDIIITTYGTARNDIELLALKQFKYIILDEAQTIKNFKSKTYKDLIEIKASNRLVLTGTPIENNLYELWGYLDFLNPGILGSFRSFKANYADNIANPVILKKLKDKISLFILRRTKKEVLTELPEKIEQDIYCEMTERQRMLYESVKLKYKNKITNVDRFVIKANSTILEGMLYLRQICCHPKLLSDYNIINTNESGKFEKLKQLLVDIKASGNKVLLFSQFTSMLKIISKWIENKGWQYSYLDGGVSDREKIISEFERSDTNNIFLISLKAGGVGINLTSANYVIIYDPWWNPASENQAIDRAYRMGQTSKVIVYKLITMKSIEEKIVYLNKNKKKLSDDMLSNQDKVKNFTVNEMKELFE